MKKIAFLMAIVGMASAETLTFDVTRSDDDVQFDFGEDTCVLELKYDCWTYNGSGNCVLGEWQSPTNANYQNTFSPSAQLCKNTDDCWTLNFTVTNTGEEAISLTQFTFDVYGINGGGGDKNSGANVWEEITLNGGSLSEVTSGAIKLGICGATSTATLDMSGLTLSANESVSLSLSMKAQTVEGNEYANNNTYSGIKSGSVTYSALSVPEPATATLSLLALAGLVARRRCK